MAVGFHTYNFNMGRFNPQRVVCMHTQVRGPLCSPRPPLCQFRGLNPSRQASEVNAITHQTTLPAQSGSPCLFTLDCKTRLSIWEIRLVFLLGSSSGYSCTQKEVVLRAILVSHVLIYLVINFLPCMSDLHEITCIANFPSPV